MKSRFVVFPEKGKAEVSEMEVREPEAGEILVRNSGCGVCQVEIKKYLGFEVEFPVTHLGHEGVGHVVAVGAGVSDFQPGDLVTTLWCPAFQEYNCLPVALAYKLPEMPVAQLPYWISEPVACALNGAIAAAVKPGERVLLLGAGYMGLLLAQLLKQSLAREFAVADLAPQKLALARQLGVATCLNAREIDLPAYAEETGFYDVVIEATGAAEMIERAGALLKTRGRLVVFADHHLHSETIAWRNFMLRSLSVAFTNPGFHPDFKGVCWRTAVGLMQAGVVRQEALISHCLPAEQCQQLMEIAVSRDPAYVKGYLAWE